MFPPLSDIKLVNHLLLIGIKILMMLPIAGISYEVIRAAGKRKGEGIWACLLWPGLQMQRLTTKEPSDDQLEIALEALKAAINTPQEAEASEVVL